MQKDFPVTIVIFGGTGDLVRKKIMPAIFDLYSAGFLPKNFEILGVSRKELSDTDYRDFIKESLNEKKDIDDFVLNCRYFSADVSNQESFNELCLFLNKQDENKKVCSNKIFYLAVAPKLYGDLFSKLKFSGLMDTCVGVEGEQSWSRILVEKPFGNDMVHAEELDKILGDFFNEDQIFRIDHYLAKETLQNILSFRFANAIFEPIWNSNSIEKIEVNMFEKLEVTGRGEMYDGVGALRDIGQNHILQMLALVAMEDPEKLDVNLIRDKRANLLEKLVFNDFAIRGQYEGYHEIKGVNPGSETETYFSIKAQINNQRWQGTDFYISGGKSLKESCTEIIITFKEKYTSICPKEDDFDYKNTIRFRIQPQEGIAIKFWSKKPGFDFKVNAKELDFSYANSLERIPDAYERVLYDAIKGDQTLFVSTKEVMAQWNFIDNVIKKWQNMPLLKYKKGVDPKEIKVTI